MAYKTADLFKQAMELVQDDNNIFITDIIGEMGIVSSTFYDHFPSNSSKYNEIMACISKNKQKTKAEIRKKWRQSDQVPAQKYLYLLAATDEERHAIHGSKTENKTELSGEMKVEQITGMEIK